MARGTHREEHAAAAAAVDEVVHVGGRSVMIRHPASAEDLIDEAAYAVDERLPYWADLWPSAHVLAGELAARATAGARVLELGCGVGLPAVVAALAGARVLATDWYPEALEYAAGNARANGARLDTLLVDWRRPPEELAARAPFDLVVGADILYEERNGTALAALIPGLVAPGGEVLVADPRRPHAAVLTDALAGAGWTHEVGEVRHAARVDESGPIIRLHRLAPPRDADRHSGGGRRGPI